MKFNWSFLSCKTRLQMLRRMNSRSEPTSVSIHRLSHEMQWPPRLRQRGSCTTLEIQILVHPFICVLNRNGLLLGLSPEILRVNHTSLVFFCPAVPANWNLATDQGTRSTQYLFLSCTRSETQLWHEHLSQHQSDRTGMEQQQHLHPVP